VLLDQDQLEVICALLAIGLVEGARSVFGVLAAGMNDPEGRDRPAAPSLWTGIQMAALAYDLAHLGTCRWGRGGIVIHEMNGTVQVIPGSDNPYFGGGLLLLSHVAAPNLEKVCGVLPSAAAMNRVDLWVSGTPVFGGWSYSQEEERFTYASFLPNLLRHVPNLDSLMIDWARQRIPQAFETGRLIAEFDAQ
jgi:hypothetical protein